MERDTDTQIPYRATQISHLGTGTLHLIREMVLPILMLCYPDTAPQLLHNDLYNNSCFSSAFFCLHSGYLGNTGVSDIHVNAVQAGTLRPTY